MDATYHAVGTSTQEVQLRLGVHGSGRMALARYLLDNAFFLGYVHGLGHWQSKTIFKRHNDRSKKGDLGLSSRMSDADKPAQESQICRCYSCCSKWRASPIRFIETERAPTRTTATTPADSSTPASPKTVTAAKRCSIFGDCLDVQSREQLLISLNGTSVTR